VADLIECGLVQAGEQFIWDRRRVGVRQAVAVSEDGMVVLADGRAFVNPTKTTNALGGYNHNGWIAFQWISDGRTLATCADMAARCAE
jgi:hypothetical protein